MALGAQNCAAEASGAYTGEVSAWMIKSTGAQYVIIGHSERRSYYHEDDKLLNKKTLLAINSGLKVIFCCGEILADAGVFSEILLRVDLFLDRYSGLVPEGKREHRPERAEQRQARGHHPDAQQCRPAGHSGRPAGDHHRPAGKGIQFPDLGQILNVTRLPITSLRCPPPVVGGGSDQFLLLFSGFL